MSHTSLLIHRPPCATSLPCYPTGTIESKLDGGEYQYVLVRSGPVLLSLISIVYSRLSALSYASLPRFPLTVANPQIIAFIITLSHPAAPSFL